MTHAEELVESRKAIEDKIAGLKSEIKEIDKALESLAWPEMENRLKMENKTHGEFKLSVDGVVIKGAVRKTVSWDSDKLKAIASVMNPDDAKELFDVKVSIPEKAYEILVECDHEYLSSIMLAREVKLSPFSIKIA